MRWCDQDQRKALGQDWIGTLERRRVAGNRIQVDVGQFWHGDVQLAVARGKTAVGVWCGPGEVVNGRVARLAERLERDPALAGSIGVNKLSDQGFVAVVEAWVRQFQSGGEASEDLSVR